MIQFLNIAGLGPIFGAIMGAKFGVSSYLWIVFGSIFAGAVHDYLAGMLSLRNGGESLPEIIGRYLGRTTKQVMRGFTVLLMILVGAVFVAGPAGLLAKLTPEQREIIFRRCSRKIRSWEKMKHLHAFFGVGGFHRFYIKDYVGGAAMLLTGGGLLIWWIIDRFKMKKKLQKRCIKKL